jgi:hypothetical protein
MKSRGDDVEITLEVEYFNQLTIYDKINVNLIQSDTFKLILKTGAYLADFIDINVENNNLSISDNNKCNWLRTFKKVTEVDVYYKELTSISNFSSGDLVFKNNIKNNLFYEAFGATGDAHIQIEADSIRVIAETGPHDIYLSGKVDYSYFYHSGFGNFHAYDLSSEIQHSNNSSTGDFYVSPVKVLIAEIRSLGNIFYSGTPYEIIFSGDGKGRLEKK